MKKLLFLLVLTITLASCQSAVRPVEDSELATNIKTKLLAEKDTITYKIIEGTASTYLVNSKTNLVEYRIYHEFKDGGAIAILILCMIGINSIIYLIVSRLNNSFK